jgi:3-oxoacyl-[acyl-carrier-protein] synthase-3
MEKINAAITAVGAYVPEFRLTNKILETMVDTNDEWIKSRTGIDERRILKGEGLASSDMGKEAVNELLKKRGLQPEAIDCIICATVTPDMFFPATANIIGDKCGLKNAFGFDVSAACSGFLYALTLGTTMIESGRYQKIIVIGVDKMSAIVDYTDRTTCVIFGDGAGAVLLEPTKDENSIKDSILKSDGSGRNFLHMKAGGSLKPSSIETVTNKEHYIYQEGKIVYKYAVEKMTEVVLAIMEKNQLKP